MRMTFRLTSFSLLSIIWWLPLVTSEVLPGVLQYDEAPDTLEANITHKRSSTDSIRIEWEMDPFLITQIEELYITFQKDDSKDVTYSRVLENNATEFEKTHLIANSQYSVCLLAIMYGTTKVDYGKDSVRKCLNLKTIPMIRNDSLIALLATLGYIILTILIAYCLWKRRRQEYEDQKQQALEESTADSEGKGEKGHHANPVEYLIPPQENRNRLSIDDEDIPYITPPISEIHEDDASEVMVDYRNT